MVWVIDVGRLSCYLNASRLFPGRKHLKEKKYVDETF